MTDLPTGVPQHAAWCKDPDHPEVDCLTDPDPTQPLPTWRAHGPTGTRLFIAGTSFTTTTLARFIAHLTAEHQALTLTHLLTRR